MNMDEQDTQDREYGLWRIGSRLKQTNKVLSKIL